MQYSFKITLKKGIKYLLMFGIPFAVYQFIVLFPDLANMNLIDIIKAVVPDVWLKLTVGAGLVMLANWGKNWAGVKWL